MGVIFFGAASITFAQQPKGNQKRVTPPVLRNSDDTRRGDSAYRIMFYNVENLFSPLDDSLTADEEYTPTGMRGWTFTKLKRKIINISKVILSVGGWEPPEIIGLCEVENRAVLMNLITDGPLNAIGYKIVHQDSPDPRGIDVALLYRPDKFRLISYKAIPVRFPFEPTSRTRDILLVNGVTKTQDTLYLFVNHWPSRFGGYANTIQKRNRAADVLRLAIDSIRITNPGAKIIAMGDFNDNPYDESIRDHLAARMDSTGLSISDLYNMMAGAGISWNRGTIKDREEWNTIDQFIVSANLVIHQKGLHTTYHGARIFDAPFLLQDDEAWFGKKTFRTYYGAAYIGGFSDHLPIYLDLRHKF